MNETFYRIICDRCGKVTVTLRLCPEHLAQWQRLLSDFLEGLI